MASHVPATSSTSPQPVARERAAPAARRKETPVKSGIEADPRFKIIEHTLKRFHDRPDALIEVLHTAQESFGYLSPELLDFTASRLNLPQSWVYGVATFYHFFSLTPQGEHTCTVCLGTACYVKRAAEILTALEKHFGVSAGETTADNRLSLGTARCLGSCGLAPVVVIDGDVAGKLAPEESVERLSAVLNLETAR